MAASVTNLAVNNDSTDAVVRITDGQPTISWTFVGSQIYMPSLPATEGVQFAFELRIGTSITNLGNTSFVGNIAATGLTVSAQSAWRYTGWSLNRAVTYYGQLRVKDAFGNLSNWYTFKFRYNGLPTVSSVSITPATPMPSDTLQVSYTFSDPDSDSEGGSTIRWFRNGVAERNLTDSLSVPSAYLMSGDMWTVEVTPNDGYEFGQMIGSTAVTVSYVMDAETISAPQILPTDATYYDPLFADYLYNGGSQIAINWFVNNMLVTEAVNEQFYRFSLNAGDQVYFTAALGATTLTSQTITIAEPEFQVFNIRIGGQAEPVNLNTTTPAISWDVIAPLGELSTYAYVMIGTTPEAEDVYSQSLQITENRMVVPKGLLLAGHDYYVSIAAGDSPSSFGPFQFAHFRLEGSLWEQSVSNSTGWTIECVVSVNSGYQGFLIADGTKFADVRFIVGAGTTSDSIAVVSYATTTVNTVLANVPTTFTIVGSGSDIKVYQNHQLVLDATGAFLQPAIDTYLEFGATGTTVTVVNSTPTTTGASDADWYAIRYSVDGAHYPDSDASFNDFSFTTILEMPQDEITAVAELDGQVVVTVQSPDLTTDVYSYLPEQANILATCVSRTYSPVNKIVQSPDQKTTFFCHATGATIFQNYPIVAYDQCLDLAAVTPEANGWQAVKTSYAPTTPTMNGIVIDTSAGGKCYYMQDRHGSLWFDKVDGINGYTVDFTMTVQAVAENNLADSSPVPEGVGVYVNDGNYLESVHFFENQIVFAFSGVVASYDTTVPSDYRLVGQGNSLQLWGKPCNVTNYTMLAQSALTYRGTQEGNAGRQHSVVDTNGVTHCVWHDDGQAGGRQVYYSYFEDGEWSAPTVIIDRSFNAANAQITCIGTKLYVAAEFGYALYTTVGLVIENEFGWGMPSVVVDSGFSTTSPQLTVDMNGDLHLVWEDLRHTLPSIYYSCNDSSGEWAEETQLSVPGNPAYSPCIDCADGLVAVGWTVKNGTSAIAGKIRTVSTGLWSGVFSVSSTSEAADFPDVLVYLNYANYVWHDSQTENFEIYYNRANSSGRSAGQQQLTANQFASMFPSIGVDTAHRKMIVVFEGNGEVSPYVDLGSFSPLGSGLYASVYSVMPATWYSSNLASNDVQLSPADSRSMRRPTIARRFTNNVQVAYEGELVTSFDEYTFTTGTFTLAMSALYNGSLTSLYLFSNTSSTSLDFQISAQLPRKEIRFGDFSDVYKGVYAYKKFSLYLRAAVQPFEIGLVANGTQPVVDDRSFAALVNNNGDAWIGTQGGLVFYFNDSNTVSLFNNELGDVPIHALALSADGFIFVAGGFPISGGTADSIFVSTDHLTFGPLLDGPAGITISDMTFDENGILWVASNFGLYGLNIETSAAAANEPFSATIQYQLMVAATQLPSNNVLCVASEPGKLWVGTDAGLVLLVNGIVAQVWTTQNSGLLSNRINSIALRNSSIRYVATPVGVCEMKFTNFSRFVSSDDTNWNNNVRAVAWVNPNILFVTTQSDISQIQLNEATGLHQTLVFNLGNYTLNATAYNDLRTYYATGFDDSTLSPNANVEVYVNGKRVPYGYVVSDDLKIIQFETPLLLSDLVQVIYRNDFQLFSTFRQNATEIAAIGRQTVRVDKLLLVNNFLYAETEVNGSKLLYRYDTSMSPVPTTPYTQIVLDTTPPTGIIKIIRQVSTNQVLVDIEYAADNLSGLSQMEISVYPNFTTDGTTPVTPVPFADTAIQTFPTTFDSGVVSYVFLMGQGTGSKIVRFNNGSLDTVYVGTNGPAGVFQYDAIDNEWLFVTTLNPASEATTDFMVSFAGNMYVGVGQNSGSTIIFQSSDGQTFTPFKTIAAPHVRAALVFQNILYLGADDGRIYSYDGVSFSPGYFAYTGSGPVTGLAGYNNNLYVAKGTTGNVVQVNVTNKAQTVIFTSPDPNLQSICTFTHGANTYLYVGTSVTGSIYVKNITAATGVFTRTFSLTAVPVSQIKIGDGSFATTLIKAAIGSELFTQTVNTTTNAVSSWANINNFPATVLDFSATPTGDGTTYNSWVVTGSTIYEVPPTTGNLTVYLKLIDAAGNATPGNSIFDQISLNDLAGYVNQNKIITLDQSGNELSVYEGSAPFYSATKVETDAGEYYSDIFFGSNNLLAWDLLTWTANTPTGTEVTIYIRSGDSRDAVLTAPWLFSYTSNFQSGVDLSSVQGAYLQFRAVLTTTVAGATPTLSNVVIRSKTSEATYFFTTNFILGSKISRGLLTAQTIVPVSAEIIWGLDTNNSTDFSDYQIITPDQIFTMNNQQVGTGMRVGIKFISPTPGVYGTDVFGEYGPYNEPLYVNSVAFNFSTVGTYNFEISFFEDEACTNLVYSQDSATNPVGFTVDGVAMTEAGVTVSSDMVNVAFVPPGNSNLVCNTFYFVQIAKDNGSEVTVISTGESFISACNTTFVDDVIFTYQNESGSSHTYQFRVRFYLDPELTDEVLVYYTGTNAAPWKANGESYPSAGVTLTNMESVSIDLHPPSSDMILGTIYYLIIDAFDGTQFVPASSNLTFRVSDPVADSYCGEYHSVPVVQNFGLVFQLTDGTLIKLGQ